MDEFAHGGADVGFARLAVGLEALAEGADGGVVGQGRQHRHVQGFAQHRVTRLGQAGLPDPLARLAQPRGQPGESHGLPKRAGVWARRGLQPRRNVLNAAACRIAPEFKRPGRVE